MDVVPVDFVGVVLPFFIDLINKWVPASKARLWVAFAVCLLVAGFLNWGYLISDPALVLAKGSFLFAQAHLVYKTYYEKSQVREKVFGM